jgi:transcriptional regulator with XRE-family HTH domain
MPTWVREAEPRQRIPSQFGYGSPEAIVKARRRARSVAAWYAQAGMGHSIGLGYLVLTLRELAGLSQSSMAARARTSQPAIARLESGRQVPSVNTLLKIASSCGMHLVVGLADPEIDAADLCMHDLTLLGILRPAPDGLVDFFVIREPPPWVGEG